MSGSVLIVMRPNISPLHSTIVSPASMEYSSTLSQGFVHEDGKYELVSQGSTTVIFKSLYILFFPLITTLIGFQPSH